MATIVDVRAALVRLGFTPTVAQIITDDQGLDTLEELRLLSEDEIENLTRAIRRPGGTIPRTTDVLEEQSLASFRPSQVGLSIL